MTQIIIEEMTVDQCRHWLYSEEETAKNWRTNPANIVEVGQLVGHYGTMPGGEAANIVNARLAEEMAEVNYEQANQLDRERTKEEIKRYYRREHLLSGGEPVEFEEQLWPEIWDSLQLRPDQRRAVLDKARAERRQRGAKTF